MGRWSSRSTVEDCKSISVKWLKKYDYFIGHKPGGMSWSRGGSIGFIVTTLNGDGFIHFQYTQTDRYSNEEIELDYKAQLVWTHCHYGGRRWWFICPLGCNRRVGVLYKNRKYFGCRHCLNLTYTSCNQSHSFDRLLRSLRIDPRIGSKAIRMMFS